MSIPPTVGFFRRIRRILLPLRQPDRLSPGGETLSALRPGLAAGMPLSAGGAPFSGLARYPPAPLRRVRLVVDPHPWGRRRHRPSHRAPGGSWRCDPSLTPSRQASVKSLSGNGLSPSVTGVTQHMMTPGASLDGAEGAGGRNGASRSREGPSAPGAGSPLRPASPPVDTAPRHSPVRNTLQETRGAFRGRYFTVIQSRTRLRRALERCRLPAPRHLQRIPGPFLCPILERSSSDPKSGTGGGISPTARPGQGLSETVRGSTDLWPPVSRDQGFSGPSTFTCTP